MNYKTKIVSQGNKYIGQLLENGQVIYTTEELTDPIIVSRVLATYISQITPVPRSAPFIPSIESKPPDKTFVTRNAIAAERTPVRQNYPPNPKKCCGRA
jgi:hypothetical protein